MQTATKQPNGKAIQRKTVMNLGASAAGKEVPAEAISLPLSSEDVKNKILEAVKLKDREIWGLDQRQTNPFENMTESLIEGLYHLLLDTNCKYQDWSRAMWDISNFLKELLILLGRPGINELFRHEADRDNASETVSKLIEFFDSIQTEETNAAMDFASINFTDENSEVLDRLNTYYDFDKRYENSSFFYDYKLYKGRENNALAYYNEHIVSNR